VTALRRALWCGATLVAAAVNCTAAAPFAQACELVLSEHRTGRELKRLAMNPEQPTAIVAFEHSVLGTTVVDTYAFRPNAMLVEERFDGAGYGLPNAAGPGERLVRDGDGWRLTLQREVQPLVVRPLPALNMRLLLAGAPLRLAELSTQAIEFRSRGCNAGSAAQ
jgi:hypothetical protein